MSKNLKVVALSIVGILGLSLLFSSGAHAKFDAMGMGFVSPQVNGKANVSNPAVGEIVYDSSDNNFWGWAATSTWSQLSVGSGAYVPVGSVSMFAGLTAPSGYFICDGSAVSRTTYATLFGIIGTTFGAGDGSTTFNLPDARGVFVRGAGTQTISGISYSGTLASTQGDQIQGHAHPLGFDIGTIVNGSTGVGGTTTQLARGNGTASGTFQASLSGATLNSGNGTPRTGNETRPANISLNYIIKY